MPKVADLDANPQMPHGPEPAALAEAARLLSSYPDPVIWAGGGVLRSGSWQALAELAERLGVPREVLYRPKRGFALPLVHWTRHELKEMILGVLLDARTLQRGYLNPLALRQLLDEHFRGRRNHAGKIWRVFMFELWHRNYLDKIHRQSDQIESAVAMPLTGGAA